MTTRKGEAKPKVVEAVAGYQHLMKALMKEALQEVLIQTCFATQS